MYHVPVVVGVDVVKFMWLGTHVVLWVLHVITDNHLCWEELRDGLWNHLYIQYNNIITSFVDQMEMQLPFLITTLVGHNKQISGIVSSHVQWLEKLLADVEKALLAREASNKKSNHAQELKELKCIYILLKPWNTEFRYGYSCTLSIPCMMYMYM